MHNDISNIALVHYMYLPTEDHSVVKAVWDDLVRRYGLSELEADDIIIGERALAHSFPFVVRNDRVAIGLLISRNITAIQLMYLTTTKPQNQLLDELEAVRLGLQNQIDGLIGETTAAVITGDNQATERSSLGAPFSKPVMYEGAVKGATISVIRPNDKFHHFYIVHEEDEHKTFDLLTSRIPTIEALIFKLARQSGYFKDQRHFLKSKKSDSDQRLSDILSQWTTAKSSSEGNIDLLEKDVERLSAIYGELVGSLKTIKNAHDTIARDLTALESLLKERITRAADLEHFKNTFTGEYSSLLKDLEFDDDLLHRALDDTRATIEVVRTRIDLERSRESFLLQREGVSVQAAAGLIELFIVWFYTLEAWELLASKEVFEHIPILLRLGIDVVFAVSVVALTHFTAKLLQKEKPNPGLFIAGFGVITSLVLMILFTNTAIRG